MSHPVTDLSRTVVLTVDDDPSMRSVVRATLERHGCRFVQVAASGARALEILTSMRVDVVICDMQMEPMDGLTLVATARAQFPDARFKVIMLTAGSPEGARVPVRDLAIDAWLFKPISGTRLIEAVGAVLGGRIEAVMPEAETDRVLGEIAARYRSKLDTDVALLTDLVAKFTQDGEKQPDVSRNLRRLLHDMRGQAGTFDYNLITSLASLGDELLHRAEDARSFGVSAHAALSRVLQVIGAAVGMVVKSGLRGDGGTTGAALMAKIEAFAAPLRVALHVEEIPKLSNHKRGLR